jgi:hypothetical protein
MWSWTWSLSLRKLAEALRKLSNLLATSIVRAVKGQELKQERGKSSVVHVMALAMSKDINSHNRLTLPWSALTATGLELMPPSALLVVEKVLLDPV